MNPIKHPGSNYTFGAPADWDHQAMPCDALAVTLQDVDGQPSIVSHWMPTADELATLVAGGLVALHIYGRGMPPVRLEAEPDIRPRRIRPAFSGYLQTFGATPTGVDWSDASLPPDRAAELEEVKQLTAELVADVDAEALAAFDTWARSTGAPPVSLRRAGDGGFVDPIMASTWKVWRAAARWALQFGLLDNSSSKDPQE